jgi:uncharacterized protein
VQRSDPDAVYVGILECDALVDPHGGALTLKRKRAVVRPVLARLRRLEVAVAEAGDADRLGRVLIAISTVSGASGPLQRVLDTCERQLAGEPELEVLSVRRRVVGPHDEN